MNELLKNKREDFIKSIEKDKDKETLLQKYDEYVKQTVAYMQEKYSSLKEETKIRVLRDILNPLIAVNCNEKKSRLFEDENYEFIRSISNKSYELAIKKINNEDVTIDFDIDETIQKLTEASKKVLDFNKEKAILDVSEATLDLMFLKNPDRNILSMRIGREYYKLKKKKNDLER